MDTIYRFRRKRVRQTRTQRKNLTRSRFHAIATLIVVGAIVTTLAGLILALVTYRSYAHDLKSPQEAIADSTIGTSLAYDRSGGTLLYQYVDPLGGLKEPVPLSEMSPYIIGATVATEDASFYGNPGVNFRGLARAAMENLTPFGPGFFEGSGGSSITQQLVKNIYIDRSERFDRRVQRKIKESVIALELKRKYDDNQILEWYLNTIDYANFAFGAEAAAQRYFGKSSKDLTLGEAALLAGLPQAPGKYTPALPENRDRAKARQIEVLDLMIKHLKEVNSIPNSVDPSQPLLQLTPEQIEAAKAEPLNYIENAYDIGPHRHVISMQAGGGASAATRAQRQRRRTHTRSRLQRRVSRCLTPGSRRTDVGRGGRGPRGQPGRGRFVRAAVPRSGRRRQIACIRRHFTRVAGRRQGDRRFGRWRHRRSPSRPSTATLRFAPPQRLFTARFRPPGRAIVSATAARGVATARRSRTRSLHPTTGSRCH